MHETTHMAWTVVAFFGAAVFLGVFPASSGPRPQISETHELISRHLEALGGREKIGAIHTLRSLGHISHDGGASVPFVQERSRPGKVRFELGVATGESTVLATDGQVSWQLEPGDQGPEELPPQQAERYLRQLALDGPLVAAFHQGYPIEFLGREAIDGREAFKLRVLYQSGEHAEFFLDAEDYLLLRMRDHWRIHQQEIVIELTFSDYRVVEGVLFPFLVEQRTSQGSWRFEVREMQPNVTLRDASFTFPGVVPASD